MPTFDVPDDPDNPYLANVVARQYGVVSMPQLKKAGVSRMLPRRRLYANRWQEPHHGVYAVFSGRLDRMATIWAAILRCGDGATASHETAAELDGLCDTVGKRVHVTVSASNRRVKGTLDGIRVHYSRRLLQTRHPARTPPRTRLEETVLDLVDVAKTARNAADWITTAVRKRMTTPARLAEALARRKRFTRRAMVEAMLLDVDDGAHSGFELQHLNKVERAHNLPPGVHQRRHMSGKRVTWSDVDHEEYDTRVELDGRLGHEGDGAFRDRQRDNRGAVDGVVTLRYGHAEVFGTPCDVAAEEAVVLQDHGWTGEPERCGKDCPIDTVMTEIRANHKAA
jgi:hypothetical protein